MSRPEILSDLSEKESRNFQGETEGQIESIIKDSNDLTAPTESQQKNEPETEVGEPSYPKGIQLGLIVFALFSSVFIVAVSQTVLATAIPTITSVFNSSDDIAWYSTGEQITAVALQLPFGQAYSLFNNKWTFLTSVVIYLVGSAVCGSAPTSVALIVGRAIQGVGMAGVFGGSFIVIARITPLRKRSLFAGLFGAAYAIASVIGPIIGGAITQRASWRWCFYFNLPIGAVVFAVVTFCLPRSLCRTSTELKTMSPLQLAKKFDLLGTTLLLASLVCLMLALQWGGGEYPWSDARVITVLVTVLPNDKIPKGTSLTLFTRLLGVALSVPVAQSVFQQELSKNLGGSVAAKIYGDGGATQINDNLQTIFGTGTAEFRNALDKVNSSLTRTFLLAMILATISFLFAILLEWKNVKKEKRSFDDAKEQKAHPQN
ncbi:MFS transporter [Colletotrichum tabaci]|uniref:MFS transporter n=1 Tax=Colletotrichum tabaci TaxID=1209068 RepID=A0AAV9T7D8_9PEZI